jgi:hypothetical protein
VLRPPDKFQFVWLWYVRRGLYGLFVTCICILAYYELYAATSIVRALLLPCFGVNYYIVGRFEWFRYSMMILYYSLPLISFICTFIRVFVLWCCSFLSLMRIIAKPSPLLFVLAFPISACYHFGLLVYWFLSYIYERPRYDSSLYYQSMRELPGCLQMLQEFCSDHSLDMTLETQKNDDDSDVLPYWVCMIKISDFPDPITGEIKDLHYGSVDCYRSEEEAKYRTAAGVLRLIHSGRSLEERTMRYVWQGPHAGLYSLFGIQESMAYDFVEITFIFLIGIIYASNWETYTVHIAHFIRWFIKVWPGDASGIVTQMEGFVKPRMAKMYAALSEAGDKVAARAKRVKLSSLFPNFQFSKAPLSSNQSMARAQEQTDDLMDDEISYEPGMQHDFWESQNLVFQSVQTFDSFSAFIKNPFAKSLLSIVMCCAASVMYSRGKWSIDSILSVEKHYEKFVVNPASFIDTFVASLKFITEVGKNAYFGDFSTIFSSRASIDEWFAEVDMLYLVSERYQLLDQLDNGKGGKFSYYEYHSRLKAAQAVSKSFLDKCDTASGRASIRTYVTKLVKAHATTTCSSELNKDRKVPFGILLAGQAGVGKTSIETMLIKFYAEQFQLPTGDEYKYNFPFESEFMDGYSTSMWAIIMEDIARMDTKKSAQGDKTVKILLDICASNPYIANAAALEVKGLIAVRPRLVIATSNTKHLNAHYDLNCPMAAARRLRWITIPTVKPEFAMVDGRMDSSKVPPAIEGEFQDLWTFTVQEPIEVVREGFKGEVTYNTILDNVTLKEYLEFMGAKMLEFDKAENSRLKNEGLMKSTPFCKSSVIRLPVNMCGCDSCMDIKRAVSHIGPRQVDSALITSDLVYPVGDLLRFEEPPKPVSTNPFDFMDDENDDVDNHDPCIGGELCYPRTSALMAAKTLAAVSMLPGSQAFSFSDFSKVDYYMITLNALLSICGLIFLHRVILICVEIYRISSHNSIVQRTSQGIFGLFQRVYADYVSAIVYVARTPLCCVSLLADVGCFVAMFTAAFVTRIISRETARAVRNRLVNASRMEKAILALLALGAAAAILKTFFGSTDRATMRPESFSWEPSAEQPSGFCAPTSSLFERYNPWHSAAADVMKCGPLSQTSRGKGADIQAKNVADNTMRMTYIDYTHRNGLSSVVIPAAEDYTIRLLGIKNNIFVTNKHALPMSAPLLSFRAKIEYGSGGAYSQGTQVSVTSSQIWCHPDKDLAFIQLTPVASLRNISGLFPFMGHTARAFTTLMLCAPGGTVTYKRYTKGVTLKNVTGPNGPVPGWCGYPDVPTECGDCGSPMWDHTNASVLGIHSLGSESGNFGCSVPIYQEDLDMAFLNLDKNIKSGIMSVIDPDLKLSFQSLYAGVMNLIPKFMSIIPIDDDGLLDLRHPDGKDIEVKDELHRKCAARDEFYDLNPASGTYNPPGRLKRIGEVIVNRSSYKSNVRSTPVREKAGEFGYTTDKVAPMLNGWIPKRKALDSMTHQKGNVDTNVLNMIVVVFAAEVISALGGEKIHAYDMYTAVNGAAGVTYVDKMNFNTSMGFPWLTKKTKFLEETPPRNGHSSAFKPNVDVLARSERVMQRYKNRLRASPIFNCQLKDEPVSPEKALIGKTRLFVCSPFDFSLVVRMALLPFIRVVQNNRYVFESGPGTICQGREWGEMKDYLCAFGENRFIAGDYKNYDKNMHCIWMLAAFQFIYLVCMSLGMSADALDIILGISIDVSFCYINFFGDLMMLFGSNPSGWPLTVIINGIVNCLYIRYAYYENNPEKEVFSFKKNVHLMTYGDDNIMGVSDRVPWFTHTAIQRTLAIIGVTYTMADKSENSIAYIHFDDTSFLKRRWVADTFRGIQVWKCPLEFESIEKMICVWVRSKVITQECQLVAVLQSAAYEAFWHGEEKFEHMMKFIRSVIDDMNLKQWVTRDTFPSYDGYIDRWFNCSDMPQLMLTTTDESDTEEEEELLLGH